MNILLYLLATLSVLFLGFFLQYEKRFTPISVTIAHVSSRDAEAMSYIVTYLLPFISVSFNDIANAISLGIVLLVIAILYVHSNLIYINPILNLFGYHLFEVETVGGKVSALICRRAYISPGSKISIISLGDYAMLEE